MEPGGVDAQDHSLPEEQLGRLRDILGRRVDKSGVARRPTGEFSADARILEAGGGGPSRLDAGRTYHRTKLPGRRVAQGRSGDLDRFSVNYTRRERDQHCRSRRRSPLVW